MADFNVPAFTSSELSAKGMRGLTKREYIATHLMAALLINRPYPLSSERTASDVVLCTDALIAELNKPTENNG